MPLTYSSSSLNDVMGYCGFILIYFIGFTESLKCYAGNPARKLECNTISYCLFITSRTGRTQWSCDGNGITQLSICSSFGMDAPRHRIYEAPPSSRSDAFYRPSEPGAASSPGSLYYVKQKLDSRLTPFVSDGTNDESDLTDNTASKNGQRCFDGGQMGKVCCCQNEFCNTANTFISNSRVFLTIFFILVYHFLL